MAELWEWIKQNKEAITIACSILGGVAALLAILSRLSSVQTLRRLPKPQTSMETEPLLPQWPEGQIGRSVGIEAIRSGFQVAPQTRLVIIDRGMRQFSREPGRCDAADARRLLAGYAIGPGAHGLQYVTVPAEFDIVVPDCTSRDGYTDVESRITVQIKVDDATAEKLVEWHLNQDGRVEVEEVRKTLAMTIEAWLKSQVNGIDFGVLPESFQALRPNAEALLQTVLSGHGLVVDVRSYEFRSSQSDARKDRRNDDIKNFQDSLESKMRQRRQESGV